MIKTFQNFQVELSGSLVTIKKEGQLVRAQSVSGNTAVEDFREICSKVEKYVKKTYA
jgi:hypothetical protein